MCESVVLSHLSTFPLFLRLNNIPLYVHVCYLWFAHPPTDKHMACAYLLVITSAAAINTDMRISLHIPIYNDFILKNSSYKQRVSDILNPPPYTLSFSSLLSWLCFCCLFVVVLVSVPFIMVVSRSMSTSMGYTTEETSLPLPSTLISVNTIREGRDPMSPFPSHERV